MLIDKWSQSSRFSRLATLTALIVIGTVAVYNWMVQPHVHYLMAAQKYEEVSNDLVGKNNKIKINVTSLSKQLADLQSQFENINSKLISQADAKKFFDNIQTKSRQAGCTVLSLNFLTGQDVKDTDTVYMKSARIKIAGNYKEIVELIKNLQNQESQVLLDSMKISTNMENEILQCDMTVTVFVLPDKENELDD